MAELEVEATVDQTLSPAEVRFFCEQGVSDRMTIIRRAHPAATASGRPVPLC
jgi:hypothetical protein